jgi:hypothetical protein
MRRWNSASSKSAAKKSAAKDLLRFNWPFCAGLESMAARSLSGLVALAQAFDSLQVLIEPFEDRFHGFICPLPIHVEVYAVF